MKVSVHFFSYFRELTGCADTQETMPEGGTLNDLCQRLATRFPKLAAMEKCTLMAVGLDYQTRSHVLKDGDEVSLFPPVQGG